MSERAIDPALLPHARPCWCSECKSVYNRLYGRREKELGVKRRYVSQCIECGAECSRRSDRCRSCANRAMSGPRRPQARCACGAPIERRKSSGMCRDCYLSSVTKTIWHDRVCAQCARSWRSRNADSVFCSPTCERASRGLGPVKKRQPRQRGVCATCGSSCVNFVCESCQREVKRIHRRIDKNRRRGARVATKYDKRAIALRDGWLCHICGGSVPPHLWGDLGHPDAPTIDHVFPVSLGGVDTEDNVRLAHRLCNIRKSNKVGGRGGSRTKRESRPIDAQAA